MVKGAAIKTMSQDTLGSARAVAVIGMACALVAGSFVWMAGRSVTELSGSSAADVHYNLLVEGFQRGQLSLNKTPPPGLAALPDPYDPIANERYRLGGGLHDMTYYRGKLYLYFGVTPALVLFWPWAVLTGHYLFHRYAVAIFCAVGFLASAGVLVALWRRYFPGVSATVVTAGTLALGLAAGVPIMLQRAEFWEVAVSCGYAFTMLALGAVWLALHDEARRPWWLAAASLAFGLAVGARPSLLFGTAVLAIPVWLAWRRMPLGTRRPPWRLLAAALGPLVLCGLALMLYNQLRFGSPFQFGERYQLAGDRQDVGQHFSLRDLWFNFCVYFLEPVRWSAHFPFAGAIATPPLPAGHFPIEDPYGALTNIPLLWLALAVPLAWRGRPAEARATLRGFLGAVALCFATSAALLGLFYGTCSRYEVEFLPELMFLAVVGSLAVEQALAGRPGARRVWRTAGALLLGFSIGFNLLGAADRYATQRCRLGNRLVEAGHVAEAIAQYESALRFKPASAEAHSDLGNALVEAGRFSAAIEECEEALRLKPAYAKAENNLGNALLGAGQVEAALHQYQAALRHEPDDPATHYNLGIALGRLGRRPEAVAQYETAVRLKPDYAQAHYNLGNILLEAGETAQAIKHYEQALRIVPEFVEARNNLGSALLNIGQTAAATEQLEAAVRLKPDYAEGHNNLGNAYYQAGRINDAIREYAAAVRLRPGYQAARRNLERMLSLLPPNGPAATRPETPSPAGPPPPAR
jgi:tetratricopeptide (TPR) repeat protein